MPDKESDDNEEIEDDMDDKNKYQAFAFLQKDIVCSLQDNPGIPSSWILLDIQLNVDLFSNKKLLTNIRDAKWTLTLYCSAGKATVINKGDMKGYETWYCKHFVSMQCTE